jgi:hypothetical protein
MANLAKHVQGKFQLPSFYPDLLIDKFFIFFQELKKSKKTLKSISEISKIKNADLYAD